MNDVGWNVSKSAVLFGHSSVENVQSAEENHVSRTSGSCVQFSFSGGSVPTWICSPPYQTGMRCPNQICRLIHQSRRLSIQWKYALRNPSCGICTASLSTAMRIIFLRVVELPLAIPGISECEITNGLSTSTNH